VISVLWPNSLFLVLNATDGDTSMTALPPPPAGVMWATITYVNGTIFGVVSITNSNGTSCTNSNPCLAVASQLWPNGRVTIIAPLPYTTVTALRTSVVKDNTLITQLSGPLAGAPCGLDNPTKASCLTAIDLDSGGIIASNELEYALTMFSSSGSDNTSVMGLAGGMATESCGRVGDACFPPSNNNYKLMQTDLVDGAQWPTFCLCNVLSGTVVSGGAFDGCDQRILAVEQDISGVPFVGIWAVIEGNMVSSTRLSDVAAQVNVSPELLFVIDMRYP